jgi:hypothetical protein
MGGDEAQYSIDLCPMPTFTTHMSCLYDRRSGVEWSFVLKHSSQGLHIRSSIDCHVFLIAE